MTNDYYDDDENLLGEIIQQEQQERLRRRLNNEALENGEEYRYILTEYLNNWTIFYWVLKRKLSRSLSRTSSSRCCIINCCMNSWLRISDSRICWHWSFWNSIIWSDKLFFGFSLTLAFLWFCFTGISVENISQNCFLWNFFSTLNKNNIQL